MNDDDSGPSHRSTPPKTPADYAYLWSGAEKAHRTWRVTSLIVAVRENWQATAAMLAIITWFTRGDIWAALKTILGIGP